MHELSIAMSVLEMVEEESQRRGGVRVHAVHLRVGPLAGVIPSALRSAFELARENSPLADAQLVIEERPLTIVCPACGGERPAVSIQDLRCADCGTPAREVAGGRELEVFALELGTDSD